MSMIETRRSDRLRELRAELADLRRMMGLSSMPGFPAPLKAAVAPRIEPIWPERNWSWPSRSEREDRRAT